jgi:hypothetical protein
MLFLARAHSGAVSPLVTSPSCSTYFKCNAALFARIHSVSQSKTHARLASLA